MRAPFEGSPLGYECAAPTASHDSIGLFGARLSAATVFSAVQSAQSALKEVVTDIKMALTKPRGYRLAA